MEQVALIGCGPGAKSSLTLEAVEAVESADLILGTRRLLNVFKESNTAKIETSGIVSSVIEEIKKHNGKKVALLVSGDTGLRSMASHVVKALGMKNCRLIPGVSSVQVAFARIGLEYYGARIISAHGDDPDEDLESFAQYDRIAVLGGRDESLKWIEGLVNSLPFEKDIFACENLTLPEEQIRKINYEELESGSFSTMIVILITTKGLSSWE